jgi:hypothetical protein
MMMILGNVSYSSSRDELNLQHQPLFLALLAIRVTARTGSALRVPSFAGRTVGMF